MQSGHVTESLTNVKLAKDATNEHQSKLGFSLCMASIVFMRRYLRVSRINDRTIGSYRFWGDVPLRWRRSRAWEGRNASWPLEAQAAVIEKLPPDCPEEGGQYGGPLCTTQCAVTLRSSVSDRGQFKCKCTASYSAYHRECWQVSSSCQMNHCTVYRQLPNRIIQNTLEYH